MRENLRISDYLDILITEFETKQQQQSLQIPILVAFLGDTARIFNLELCILWETAPVKEKIDVFEKF